MAAWEPPREVVMEALFAALTQQLTGPRPWGGSYPRPVTVSRIFRHPYQVPETPHVILIEDDGSEISAIGHDSDDPATLYDDRFRFQIFAYVDGDDLTPPSKWMNRVNTDCKRIVQRALAVGGPLDGIASNLRFLGESVDFHDTRAACAIPCSMQLRYPLGLDLELP